MTPPAAPRAGLAGRLVLWAGLALGLAPFAWACGFCFPRGDDFDEVTRAMFLFDLPGGLYEAGREWLTWSGRYTYHFLAVFLGKAGESRALAGLVCAGVLALHGLAFYGLARQARLARKDAAPLAGLALTGLCASSGYLPGYYLLTEALTTGLQSAAALGFFWSLCALWNACARSPHAPAAADAAALRRATRRAAVLGVLACGVYEHAALAALAGAGIALLLAWFHDRRQGKDAPRVRPFLRVAGFCLAGALISFLAPGNFVRKAARGVDAEIISRQVAAIPADWLAAMQAFMDSPWPLTALALALLVWLMQKRGNGSLARAEALVLAGLIPAAFGLFSVGLASLHALSDVPLSASTKLGASLGLYAALALGFSFFALLRALPAPQARLAACPIGGALILLCLASANFQRTLANAVNGSMALYAGAMQEREAWLGHVGAASPWAARIRFGLAGEVLHPGARQPQPGPAVTPVARWPWPAFPVKSAGDLPARATDWPNQWVAWMYGVEAVATLQPRPAAALAACGRGEGVALDLPPEARGLGLTGAWRVNAQGGPNPTFAFTWLVIENESPLPKTLELFVPSPLSPSRMAPLFLQAWVLRRLEEMPCAAPEGMARFGARLLSFPSENWRVPGGPRSRYAFPLGPALPLAQAAPAPGEWPGAVFLRLPGTGFLRLDSARESG